MAGVSQASIAVALESPEAEERRQATALMAHLPIDLALPLIVRALGDQDWRVRKEATLVSRAFLGEEALIAALTEILAAGDNVGLRNAAVDVLASAGSSATAALGKSFPSLDADGRKLVVETLGRARDPGALPILDSALRDGDLNVRQTAIEAIAGLGRLAPESVERILLAYIGDKDRLVALTALEGLTALGVVIPWPNLAPLLDDPTLRPSALAAAALTSSPEAAGALVNALAASRGSAFQKAAQALAQLSEGALEGAIGRALKAAGSELGLRLVEGTRPLPDGDTYDFRAASLRLAALAEAPGAVDAAIAAIDEEGLAEAAQRALMALGPAALSDVVQRLSATQADPTGSSELGAVLVDVIAEIARQSPTEGASQALRAVARSADREACVRAIYALSTLGDESDIGLATDLVGCPSNSVAVAAEGMLAALVGRFPAAARAFVDRIIADPTQHTPTAIILGALGSASAHRTEDADVLAHIATAGVPRARRAAVGGISAMRGSAAGASFAGAMYVLELALTDEEREVQVAAARALGRLCAATPPLPVVEVLDLVQRLGTLDLLAATVRAIGEGIAPAGQDPVHLPAAVIDDLVTAIGTLACDASGAVAMAAVETLGRTERAGYAFARAALVAALRHTDDDVAKAALLKLAASKPDGMLSVTRALDHPSAAVRILAIEVLGDTDSEEIRLDLALRALSEPDRMVKDTLLRALGRPSILPGDVHDHPSTRRPAPSSGRTNGGH